MKEREHTDIEEASSSSAEPPEEVKYYRMPEEEAQKISRKLLPNPFGSHNLNLR
jgi:hypothetical protein